MDDEHVVVLRDVAGGPPPPTGSLTRLLETMTVRWVKKRGQKGRGRGVVMVFVVPCPLSFVLHANPEDLFVSQSNGRPRG